MENIFEIKNNFIPPKDQELISTKFDNNLGRDGNVEKIKDINYPLGTEDITVEGAYQAELNTASPEAAVLGQIPVPIPLESEEYKTI